MFIIKIAFSLRLMYDDSPDLGVICLPLLIYHPVQILIGGLVVPYYKAYIRRRTV